MGIFDAFKRKITTTASTIRSKPKNELSNFLDNSIPENTRSMLWFFDGPFKNISLDTEEPSGIGTVLPIKKGLPEKLGYWPSYQAMSPEQRYTYLEWLTNVDNAIDIGYVFTFFYGLERFIGTEQHNEAVAMIARLKAHHKNKSFNHYSNAALAYAALLYKDATPLKFIKTDGHDATFLLLSKTALDKRLTASEITDSAKDFSWTNVRYIKSNHDLFISNLSSELKELYGGNYYPIPKDVGKVPSVEVMLANVSLNLNSTAVMFDKISFNFKVRMPKTITIPDFSKSEIIQLDVYQLLKIAHEKTKNDLAIQRSKNGSQFKEKSPKTSKKIRVNPHTGFPMAKESAIERAQETYDQTISLKRHTSTGDKTLDLEMQTYDFVLPHYSLGDLYYKKGEWRKAEKEWLMIVTRMGSLVSIKLSIMYHKQKRFRDEVSILTDGLKYSINNNAYPLHDKDAFASRITKATTFLTNHIDEDQSVGYELNE